MQEFKGFVNTISPVSETTWRDLAACFTPTKMPSRTKITELGKVPNHLYFLKDGLIRAYLLTAEGKEYNKTIFSPPSLLGSLAALIQKSPSKLIFETLTACTLFEAEYSKVAALYDRHNDLNKFSRKMLERFFIEKENREIELLTLEAKDRYLNLRKAIPNVDQLISQYHIASYIGVSPTQLSRIRKDLRKG